MINKHLTQTHYDIHRYKKSLYLELDTGFLIGKNYLYQLGGELIMTIIITTMLKN